MVMNRKQSNYRLVLTKLTNFISLVGARGVRWVLIYTKFKRERRPRRRLKTPIVHSSSPLAVHIYMYRDTSGLTVVSGYMYIHMYI